MNFCGRCIINWPVERLVIKMGGLLCPECRKILVWPENPTFWEEKERRDKELSMGMNRFRRGTEIHEGK